MGDDYEDYSKPGKSGKQNNVLPIWGNEQTMNMNPLILANIQSSSYFKVHLFKLKTYHEVVDEIYYQVKHLEPWERGSRKTAGQTGMCGGVRGVGAGGIVSTAYCLLYKLYTLRLTRKQVNSLMGHPDSPFIRALGFMYVRYTQPPGVLLDWYEEYLQDDEALEPRAGGGQPSTIGALARHLLTKLDWFSTLFPRIPVPIQKTIEQRLGDYDRQQASKPRAAPEQTPSYGEAEKYSRDRNMRRDNKESYKPEWRDVRQDLGRERDRERDRDRERSGGDRGDRSDRYRSDRDRQERTERPERSDKVERSDRIDRSDRLDRGDRGDRTDRDRQRQRDRSPRDRRHR